MARMRSDNVAQEEIDQALDELDLNMKRLRIEYEQYFAGTLRRAPQLLQGKVQKLILQFAAQPPRNTRQKFRFNQLNSRYQVFRQQWGRTQRQIDDGTYKPHQFKARMRDRERGLDTLSPAAAAPASEAPAKKSGVDQLYDALMSARRRTGDHDSGLDRDRLASIVRRQTETIRAQHGSDARVKFRVVVEDGKAKVKASVAKG